MTKNVTRVRNISASSFRDDFFLANQPVVLEGAALEIPAYHRWTDEYLLRVLGDSKVRIRRGNGGQAKIGFRHFLAFIRDPSQFRVGSAGGMYLDGLYLRPDWSVLAADVPSSPLPMNTGRDGYLTMYFGPHRSSTPIHQDSFETAMWMAVLRGKKLWTLAAPDPKRPEETEGLEWLEAEVNEGDVIYVPELFWHSVENVGVTLGVSENIFKRVTLFEALTDCRANGADHWAGVLGRLVEESTVSSSEHTTAIAIR